MGQASRRKACDTCHNRKIKCDLAKPICSNCKLYDAQCVTTSTQRRVLPIKQREGPVLRQQIEAPVEDSIQARLARIETKIDSLGASKTVPFLSFRDESSVWDDGSSSQPQTGMHQSNISHPGSSETMEFADLPPLHEVLPVVEVYFRDFNACALPLFHEATFMKMLHGFYLDTEHRSKVVWAAINSILAIGYRICSVEKDPVQFSVYERRSEDCASKARSILDELILRDDDTLGIQVILALIITYQASPNQKSACILIGIAVRLAHRLRLEIRAGPSSSSTFDELRQRANVFWICYIFDKELSCRTKMPAILQDRDIDLDLPETDSTGNNGVMCSIDGLVRFNYFRARVQIANLEGRIYEALCSVHSIRSSPQQRQQQLHSLDREVAEWRRTIPTSLQVEHMDQSLSRAAAVHMATLQHHYLLCLVLIHGLYSVDSKWVKAIGEWGQEALANFDSNTNICMREMQPTLPSAWSTCVLASRGSVTLFLKEPQNGCGIWLNMGAYFSGLVILLANIQYFPTHDLVDHDHRLAKSGLNLLARTIQLKDDQGMGSVINVLRGLDSLAAKALAYFQSHPLEIPSPPFNGYENHPHPNLDLVNGGFSNTSETGITSNMQLSERLDYPDFNTYSLDTIDFDPFSMQNEPLSTDYLFQF